MAKTKEVLNQAITNCISLIIEITGSVWDVFIVWHLDQDEYMDSLDGYLDEISSDHSWWQTPLYLEAEFLQHSEIEEEEGGIP